MIHAVYIMLLLALVPFAFSIFLYTCFGFPGNDDFNIKAIFFGWAYFFAKMRAKKYKKYYGLIEPYREHLKSEDAYLRQTAENNMRTTVFNYTRHMFTWEKAFGMCLVCFNVWVSLFFSFSLFAYYHNNWYYFLIVPFSNLYILLFHKL